MAGITASTPERIWLPTFGAWFIALVSSLGALFIGEVMGQAPCDLCWHQRAFMFPLALILAVAAFRSDAAAWFYALPVAAVGWLMAGFHNLLYFGIVPSAIKPCGQGPSCSGEGMLLFGVVPLPLLSLAAFTLIITLLLVVRRRISQ
ncbi:disulfide bond formation protein B [Rhizobium sp. LC145]|uniref:disulfide bond formation protein B n=1 Tax=Rhizobium sp. LC145 TaxID=1120688 RepID=UPI00062A49AE|nr:disulfide bond formation protein B [Rhizobium sp. LC145]KKX29454.1 disulfide bond formation protein [Rhizobium sp. LC145]MDX3927997.1 disulfide bond formation protein B [Shinella sp.]TKT66167.1 disulfide bond formation protein B [Rhizobiaceae bacterium LC148]